MSPPNTSPKPQAENTTETVTPITAPVTNNNLAKNTPIKTPRERAKNTAITFFKNGAVITFAIVAFQWLNFNFKIGNKLLKINIEVWISLSLTAGTTYFDYRSEKEREKLKLAQEKSAENTATIKTVSDKFQELVTKLDGRVGSTMVQIAQLRSDLAEIAGDVEGLQKGEEALRQRIEDNRYEVLKERFELLKDFAQEIREIHTSISYIRGFREGDRPVTVEKINEILVEVASQVKQLEVNRPREDPQSTVIQD